MHYTNSYEIFNKNKLIEKTFLLLKDLKINTNFDWISVDSKFNKICARVCMVQPALIAFANLYAFNSPFLGLLFFLLNWLFSFIYLHNPFFTRIFRSSLIFPVFTRCFVSSLAVAYLHSLFPIFTHCFVSSLADSYLHSLFPIFTHCFLSSLAVSFYTYWLFRSFVPIGNVFNLLLSSRWFLHSFLY